MGAKLEKLFEFAMENGGLATRMRVSMMSAIPSATAGSVEDSPENVAKLRNAIKEVTGERRTCRLAPLGRCREPRKGELLWLFSRKPRYSWITDSIQATAVTT